MGVFEHVADIQGRAKEGGEEWERERGKIKITPKLLLLFFVRGASKKCSWEKGEEKGLVESVFCMTVGVSGRGEEEGERRDHNANEGSFP